jgi:hypothetical protein
MGRERRWGDAKRRELLAAFRRSGIVPEALEAVCSYFPACPFAGPVTGATLAFRLFLVLRFPPLAFC